MSSTPPLTVVTRGTAPDQAPPISAFAKYPASWYLFGAGRELSTKPMAKSMFGRKLVAFRTAQGAPVVLESRCAHLGADLSHGKVEGDKIRCPFHGWAYGADGRCVDIPNTEQIPPFARQNAYAVEERHGLVFVFNAVAPLFPLPFFFEERAEEYSAAKPAQFAADSPWYMVAAHGYDLQHFETVHGRKLVTPLEVDCPAPFARRSQYRAQIVGNKYYDRFLRRSLTRQVAISITTWGGTLVLITGNFGCVQSQFIIALNPLEDQRTECSVIVLKRRSRAAPARWFWDPVSLALRKLLTRGYLVDEVNGLGGPRYAPQRLIAADREMIAYFRWVAALPQGGSGATPMRGSL